MLLINPRLQPWVNATAGQCNSEPIKQTNERGTTAHQNQQIQKRRNP
jgi:hypothetical protein